MAEPQVGVAYTFYRSLFSLALPGEFQGNPTLEAGDFKVKKDTGSFVNLATLPVLEPAGGTTVKFVLSATEMTASIVIVQAIDQTSPKEWGDAAWQFDVPVQTVDSLYTALVALLGTPAGASISADLAAIEAQTDDIGVAGAGLTGLVLSATERQAIADALLDRNMATGTDSGSESVRTVRQFLRGPHRSRFAIVDTTLTVYKENDTDVSHTLVLTPAPGADPVSAGNPAGP